jgi:hypothetical protein
VIEGRVEGELRENSLGTQNAGQVSTKIPVQVNGQWPGIRSPGVAEAACRAKHRNVAHRAGKPLGERLLRMLLRQAAR